MAAGLWLTPFYIRALGPHDYGIWIVALQVLNFLLLCDFGIIAVAPRNVAHAHGLERSDVLSPRLTVLVGQTMKVVVVQTGVIAVGALGLFLFRPAGQPGLRGPIGLILLVFVLSYPLRLFPAVLQGLQDLKFLGQLRICLWALSTTVAVVLLVLGERFWALAVGWCIQQIGHDLVAFYRMSRLRPDLLPSVAWKQAGPLNWRWFTRGFWVSVGQFAYLLAAGTDVLISGRILGSATVVIYSCTSKLVTVLQNQPQTLAAVALPGLSQMKTSESPERILRAMGSLSQAMLALAGMVFCVVLCVNQSFVQAWVGAQFFGGIKLTVVMLLNFLVRQIDYTLALVLFALGYEKFITIRLLADGVVSVTVAIILASHWGLEGVALGFLCGAVLVAIPADIFGLTRDFQISGRKLFRPHFRYLWRALFVGAISVALGHYFGTANLLHVAGLAVLTVLIYAGVVLPHLWKGPLGPYIRSVASPLFASIRRVNVSNLDRV